MLEIFQSTILDICYFTDCQGFILKTYEFEENAFKNQFLAGKIT